MSEVEKALRSNRTGTRGTPERQPPNRPEPVDSEQPLIRTRARGWTVL